MGDDASLGLLLCSMRQSFRALPRPCAQEPLAADSPLWHHPQVRIFPHISSTPHLPSAVALMLENRAAILEGRPLPPHAVVDRQRGY